MSDRRRFLKSAAMGAPVMMLASTGLFAQAGTPQDATLSTNQTKALKPPANGLINVAFVISEDANVMDIAGAWEVFSETMLTAKGNPLRLQSSSPCTRLRYPGWTSAHSTGSPLRWMLGRRLVNYRACLLEPFLWR